MNQSLIEPVYFLLVDDLPENLLSLEALLRREGLVMLKARSGPEALELLLQHDIALALLDVQMPGMDGFELAELMRGMEKTKRIPIIFLTAGSADWQRRFRGYEAGAVDFLHKPIEPDILRSKAEVFFELYRQRQLLAAQRDELSLYTDVLKQADRRKDEFLATLAHELRNPLAPIRNGLQILLMSPNGPETQKIRDMMDRQLTHLVRLIDDLLDVSRINEGKIDLRKETILVQDCLRAAIEASKPLIDAGQHVFKADIPAENLYMNADLTRISQVVSNLLNNAAKYTPDGGRITLRVVSEGDNLALSVSDNGIGIPQDMLPHVFDLFTQINRNESQSQGGLGIGLALVKRLVEMHEGQIYVESGGAAKGSTFTIRLPLIKGPDKTPDPDRVDQTDEDKNVGLKILVVDDNIPSAQTIGWMLEIIGHDPVLAHDGLQALETARAIKPEVILLDIGLPGMDGYQVARELRQDPAFEKTVLIAQTGWGQERDRRNAFDAGFNHHLIKPVDFEELKKLLMIGSPKS